jgi:hypothetical protein
MNKFASNKTLFAQKLPQGMKSYVEKEAMELKTQ